MQIKGFHMELRGQRMRAEKIIDSMRDAAWWGYTHMMLEYSDKFPYKGRIADAVAPDALTREEIQDINKAAKDLGVEIIPLVQCLGHLYWAMRRPSLKSIGEGNESDDFVAWRINSLCMTSVCPSKPTGFEFFKEMAEQVLEMHPDCKYLHMGGDEVKLDEKCPYCKPRRETIGIAGIYADHYSKVADWIRSTGRNPIMWCDMILGHPESLDTLRGKVTVMDWDYGSTDKPSTRVSVWGVRAENKFKPEIWPEPLQRIVKPYLFTEDGTKIRPFPYTPLLKDQKFDVIVAPAARAGGDTFFATADFRVENVINASKTAAKNDTLGTMVTSWALRRAPWPLTEYSLIAGAITMVDPEVDRVKIDTRFAEEHFGVSDPELARIMQLIGAENNPLTSAITYIEPDSGMWLANGYEKRLPSLVKDPEEAIKLSQRLLANYAEARKLLDKAEPKTDWQLERVKMWGWAIRCSECFAELIPQAVKEPGTHDTAELKQFRERILLLQSEADELLGPWLTDWTMISERQCKFGIHLDWIDEMLKEL